MKPPTEKCYIKAGKEEDKIKIQEESLQVLSQISCSVGTKHPIDMVNDHEIELVKNEQEETKICKDQSSTNCNQSMKQISGRAINSQSHRRTMTTPVSTTTSTSFSGIIDSDSEEKGEELLADKLQTLYSSLLENFSDEDQCLEYQKRTAEASEITAKAT